MVISMPKTLKVILISIFVGSSLAILFFLNIKDSTAINTNLVTVYQVGAFKNEINAYKLKNEYEFAKVVKIGDYYRVFIGITYTNQELFSSWFNKKNINYYQKEIDLDPSIIESLKKYDTLLLNSNEENYDIIMQNMLGVLPNEL